MITVISGTNRNEANTLRVAKLANKFLNESGEETQFCDLNTLPKGLFEPEHYWNTPETFKPFQEMILNTDGLLVVTPEYNGSFPGALKYFIDLLKFPESLHEMPSAFIGVSSGRFGALRSIEQLEMIFQYREAHIFGKRSMFMGVENKLSSDGSYIADDFTKKMFESQLTEFIEFCKRLKK